jgi:tryptophanyl-tRNA synthetase
MKSYKKFLEEVSNTYIVTYDGRYGKRVSASSPEEAIKIRDKQKTMKNKKKIMKFSYDKYDAKLVK